MMLIAGFFFKCHNYPRKIIYVDVLPPASNSHHHDYYMFGLGDPYESAFATVAGRGFTSQHTITLQTCLMLHNSGYPL